VKKNNEAEIIAFGSNYLIANIQNLQASMNSVEKRIHDEDIHDLRVASRRVRTALEIFAPYLPPKKIKLWQNSVRKLTKAFGSVRDLDVQLDFIKQLHEKCEEKTIKPGIRRIFTRLSQKRGGFKKNLQETLSEYKKNDILNKIILSMESMSVQNTNEVIFPPALFQLAFEVLHKKLDKFLFYEIFIPYPEKTKELHQMRIAAKQLRYSLEVFASIYSGKMDDFLQILRDIQTDLGNIRDCDVWVAYLPRFIEKEKKLVNSFFGNTRPFKHLLPGIQYIQNNREDKRNALYQEFVRHWENWHKQDTWGKLRQEIVEPVIKNSVDNFHPPLST